MEYGILEFNDGSMAFYFVAMNGIRRRLYRTLITLRECDQLIALFEMERREGKPGFSNEEVKYWYFPRREFISSVY